MVSPRLGCRLAYVILAECISMCVFLALRQLYNSSLYYNSSKNIQCAVVYGQDAAKKILPSARYVAIVCKYARISTDA